MGDWFDESPTASAVDVLALLDSDAGPAIGELVQLGALVSIGTTRDGGALAITVTVDGRWRREYFREAEELVMWLSEAVPAVRVATEALSASAERGSGKRRRRGL